jgi:phosphoglycerate dehydrogenase-like enzyme
VPIALIPSFVAPNAPDVIGYDEVVDPAEELLAQCGFFVPHYLGPDPNAHLMARMPLLERTQLLTAGFEAAIPYLPDGVVLSNAVGVHDAATSELAVGLILASLRGIDTAARAMTTATWIHGHHVSLADRSVLILGAGGVGSALARRLEGFEAEVTLVGRTRRTTPAGKPAVAARVAGSVAGISELQDLLPKADIVVLAVPLTDETRGFVDAGFLAQMLDGALLVNIARGPVVKTEDLVAALMSGRIRAALDVTDPEPLPVDHPLWRCPNVLITGHLGGNTTSFPPRAIRLVTEQLRRWRVGEPALHVVAGKSA